MQEEDGCRVVGSETKKERQSQPVWSPRRGDPAATAQPAGGARRPDGLVEIAVIDNGGGIPEAVMERLFEPFFTTKPPGKGTGLGLSICHAAMQSFDGRIEVANTDDGACFRLLFRAAPLSAPAAGEDVAQSCVSAV